MFAAMQSEAVNVATMHIYIYIYMVTPPPRTHLVAERIEIILQFDHVWRNDNGLGMVEEVCDIGGEISQ